MSSWMTRTRRGVATAGVMLAATLVVGECIIRIARPTPRVQMVHPGRMSELGVGDFRIVDEVPVWGTRRDELRHNRQCADERPDAPGVLVVGSSILAASGLKPEEAFSVLVQAHLEAQGPACVVNLAEGAYTFDNQLVVAREVTESWSPEVIYWEIWQNSPYRWTMLRGTAHRFQDVALGADGYPNVFRLPSAVNRTLFHRSRLYAFATLALVTESDTNSWADFAESRLPEAVELAQEVGAELVFVFCPSLDRPFADSLRAWDSDGQDALVNRYRTVAEFADRHDLDTIRLEEPLADDDVELLRMDACCHFAAPGHRRLADVFEADLATRGRFRNLAHLRSF